MDNTLIERLRTEMHKQFARTAPPDDFRQAWAQIVGDDLLEDFSDDAP